MRSSHVWRALFEAPKLISWFQHQAPRQAGTRYWHHFVFLILVGTVLLQLPSALFAESPEYRVVPIPAQLDYGRLNASDVVVGRVWSRGSWVWNKGLITNLPGLGSGGRWATDINNNGVVVGTVSEANGQWHGCVWHNGMLSILDAPGHLVTWASSINSVGTVIGKATDTTDAARPVYPFISTGSVTTLHNLENYEFNAINDGGIIAGTSWSSQSHESGRAFMYDGGTVTFLSDPGSFGEAFAINNSNHVLCEVNHRDFYLWKNGTRVFLESFTNFGGLNDSDVVVGYSSSLGAVIWENGEVRRLDSLIDSNLGLHFVHALDINNKGRILCKGSDNMAYLLIPDSAITVRDAKNEIIPNVEFNLIKVTNDPPIFTEETLGSFTTNGEGRLELTVITKGTFEANLSTGAKRLVVGDSLKIAKHVHSVPAAKHEGVLGTMYSIHLDNAHFAEDGHMYFDTLKRSGLEVVLNHTELRYNLLVSVEWDAAVSYLESLGAGLKAMSNYLYDVSDGQIRLDTVQIVDNKANWDDADIKIYASNMVHPHVDLLNGIVRSGPSGAPVEMPRKWFGDVDPSRNGTYTENPLNLEDDVDFRTKCHELGHYALNFGDEYRFADGSGVFVPEIGRCGAIANYGFMDHPFEGYGPLASEMSSIYQYTDEACRNTHQFALFFGSCWDHLEEQYEWEWGPASIFVPIITPDDAERELPDGFDYLPGPNGEMFVLDYDVGALVQFPVEKFPPDLDVVTLQVQVSDLTIPMSKVDITLYNDYFGLHPKTIYQGQTSDGFGAIWVVGASRSNRLIQASKGGLRILPKAQGSTHSSGKEVWLCGEASVGGVREKRVSNQSWLEGDSVTIELRTVEGDYPLICGVSLGDDTATYRLDLLNPFSAPPKADLLPDAGGVHSYDFTTDGSGYGASMTDSLGGSGTITVWAKDDLSQDFFFSTNYTVAEFDTGAATWSLTGPLGEAEVWIDTSNATLQKGMILSSPYLIIRTGLTDVNIQAGETHSIAVYPLAGLTGHNQVVIRYAESDLDAGTGIVGRETSLQVFNWNGGSHQWESIGGSVDTIRNTVSAVISDVGIYAAFTTNIITDVEDDERGDILPYKFELSQNYPNPFNPVTTIEYAIPSRCEVTIEVFNVLGQKVRTLVNESKSAGSYRTEWNGNDDSGKPVSTGVYLYRFQAGEVVQTKKMLLLK